MISDNIRAVRNCINAACLQSGRQAEDVTLLCVSKTKPLSCIRECIALGEVCFGENYVQELVSKYEEIGDEIKGTGVSFHMIGHLQRNKVKYIIDKVSMIESVDSLRLAEKINEEAGKKNIVMDILLEVNIAGEESKWGFSEEEVKSSLDDISALKNIRVRGFMTSAPYTENPETNRVHFRALKTLFDSCREKAGECFDTLSMGMTGDYSVAVEEGSTIVRVGTGIFGERNYF